MAKAGIFDELLVHCAPAFNQPRFENFCVLVAGWVLAGMRAMTSTALRALGSNTDKHFSTYYRFFSRAVWQPDAVGNCLLALLMPFAPPGPLVAIVDDTIARKSGPSFADMHQTARYALLRQGLFATPNRNGGEPKLTDHAECLLRLAA